MDRSGQQTRWDKRSLAVRLLASCWQTRRRPERYRRGVLHALPFSTFGEIAALGLEVHVWCMRCKSTRRVDITPAMHARHFAGARFRCERVMWDGQVCGSFGARSIRRPERLPTGTVCADLCCGQCVPPWEILDVDHRSAPWALPTGDRFRCPSCGSRFEMREKGPPWRPSHSRPTSTAATGLGETQ
jgi:hypothetical protein